MVGVMLFVKILIQKIKFIYFMFYLSFFGISNFNFLFVSVFASHKH
jgi:hypothetical protein